jgi:hypothetical protein
MTPRSPAKREVRQSGRVRQAIRCRGCFGSTTRFSPIWKSGSPAETLPGFKCLQDNDLKSGKNSPPTGEYRSCRTTPRGEGLVGYGGDR